MQFHLCGARSQIRKPEDVLEKLDEFCESEQCEGQIIDADMVFGRTHVITSYEHAKRAFDEERNASRSLAMEVLLYMSGERQISTAIEKMGIKDGTREFCIVLLGEADIEGLIQHLGVKKDDSVLEGDISKLRAFGISQREMDTLPEENVFDLVLERVAMVDLMK